MPIYLGNTPKDIPYKKAYLGENLVYDALSPVTHYVRLYDYGTESVPFSADISLWDSAHPGQVSPFNSQSFQRHINWLSYVGTGNNQHHNYGAISTTETFDMSSFGSLYVKLRTTNMDYPGATFAGVFPSDLNFKNSTNEETIKMETSQNQGVVTLENEPNFVLNFETTGLKRVVVGCYALTNSVSGTITQQQGFNLFAAYLFMPDNWTKLASMAGITAATMDVLIQNAATLLANEDAVDYMISKCTGTFMINALNNSTFKAALDSSAYKAKIMNNATWLKFYNLVYKERLGSGNVGDMFPMMWTAQGNGFTETNYLGTWDLEASQTYSAKYSAKEGMNLYSRTYFNSGELETANTELTLEITPPVSIKPRQFELTYTAINSDDGRIQGYANGAWENLATIPSNTAPNTKRTEQFQIETDTYYEAFRVYAKRWNSSNKSIHIYTFALTDGYYDL